MTSDYETLLKDLEICTNIYKNCYGCSRSDPDGFPGCQGEGDIRIRARDAIKELVNRLPKWISVKERLPKDTGTYLVWCDWDGTFEEPSPAIINYDADCEKFGEWEEYLNPFTLGQAGSEFCEIKGVYYWMPLPEPPEENKHDA